MSCPTTTQLKGSSLSSATSASSLHSSLHSQSARKSSVISLSDDRKNLILRFAKVRHDVEQLFAEILFAFNGDSMHIDYAIDELYGQIDALAAMKQDLMDFADENQFRHIRDTDESQPR